MRQSAIWFAQQLDEGTSGHRVEEFDCIVTTDMLNVAEIRGLIAKRGVAAPRILTYYHENQFEYPSTFSPGSAAHQRDQHFAFTNFISAIASDNVWFNSQFNLDSMRGHLQREARRWPDYVPDVESAFQLAQVHPPGIDAPPIDTAEALTKRRQRGRDGEPLRLVWAARWEHDKGPDRLLAGLRGLRRRGIPFELSLLGQSYRQVPDSIGIIQDEFANDLRQIGFATTKSEYWRILADADVFVSTAIHEFFGLAAAEAIAAGLWPVLPRRLAYPELLSYGDLQRDRSLLLYASYDNTKDAIVRESEAFADLILRLDQLRRKHPDQWGLGESFRKSLLDRVVWPKRAKLMDRDLERMMADMDR